MDRSDKAVSAAGDCLDKTRAGGGISEGLADLVDGGVQAVIEVDESVGGPELLLQLLAGDDLAGAVEQESQDLERLSLEAEPHAILAQFPGGEIELEDSEAGDSGMVGWDCHGRRASVAPGTAGVRRRASDIGLDTQDWGYNVRVPPLDLKSDSAHKRHRHTLYASEATGLVLIGLLLLVLTLIRYWHDIHWSLR